MSSSYFEMQRLVEALIEERMKADMMLDSMYGYGEGWLDACAEQRFISNKDLRAVKRMQRHFARRLYKRGHFEYISWMPFWQLRQWWDSKIRKLY